jgi:CCR4-NOT transcription complex subunit 2
LSGVSDSEANVGGFDIKLSAKLLLCAKRGQAFSNAQFASTINISQREDNTTQSAMSRTDGPPREQDSTVPRSQTLDSTSQSNVEESGPEVQDPLAGMNEIDRWGLKGFSLMMSNFPDYATMVAGDNIQSFGFDLGSTELVYPRRVFDSRHVLTRYRHISSQTYSLFADEPPRPSVPRFILPECYTVGNIAALDSKLSNFNDEALIFMFYSNPGDIQQILAATEL